MNTHIKVPHTFNMCEAPLCFLLHAFYHYVHVLSLQHQVLNWDEKWCLASNQLSDVHTHAFLTLFVFNYIKSHVKYTLCIMFTINFPILFVQDLSPFVNNIAKPMILIILSCLGPCDEKKIIRIHLPSLPWTFFTINLQWP